MGWKQCQPMNVPMAIKPSHSEVRESIGSHLQEYYAAMKEMPLSDHLDSLLGQLKEAERSSPTESATEKSQNDSEQKTS
jgi:hypothetical protein